MGLINSTVGQRTLKEERAECILVVLNDGVKMLYPYFSYTNYLFKQASFYPDKRSSLVYKPTWPREVISGLNLSLFVGSGQETGFLLNH